MAHPFLQEKKDLPPCQDCFFKLQSPVIFFPVFTLYLCHCYPVLWLAPFAETTFGSLFTAMASEYGAGGNGRSP